ncbi:hypothetical protein [Carp edema virus]|nr:hypothetical protein [Carp edema virus]
MGIHALNYIASNFETDDLVPTLFGACGVFAFLIIIGTVLFVCSGRMTCCCKKKTVKSGFFERSELIPDEIPNVV